MQNFFSNMAPGGGGEGGGPQSDVPWWMRYAGKGAGIGGGVGKWQFEELWLLPSVFMNPRLPKYDPCPLLTAFFSFSGRFLWILVLYLIFSSLHCGWYLADLCGSICNHTWSSVLLHVFGLCSASSGQSRWQTSLAKSSRVPSVRIFFILHLLCQVLFL